MIKIFHIPQDYDKGQNHASKHLRDELKHHIWVTVLGYACELLLQWHWYLERSDKEEDLLIFCLNQLWCTVESQVDQTSTRF